MHAAVQAGANIINDVYALRQAGALEMAASLSVPVCLKHMQESLVLCNKIPSTQRASLMK